MTSYVFFIDYTNFYSDKIVCLNGKRPIKVLFILNGLVLKNNHPKKIVIRFIQ